MLERSMLDVATIDTLPDADAPPAEALPPPQPEVQPRRTLATRIAFRLSFLNWIQERPFNR